MRKVQDAGHTLEVLLLLDFGAARAYEETMQALEDQDLLSRFAAFRDDHVRHVGTLDRLLRGMGKVPPGRPEHVKGYILQWVREMERGARARVIIRVMLQHERLTNRMYADALQLDATPEIEETLRLHFSDEQRHLEYMRSAMKRLDLQTVPVK